MIRINLLSEGRKPIAVRKSPLAGLSLGTGGLDLGTMALVGLIVVGLLVALTHNWLLSRQVSTKGQEINEAQAEVDRLAPIIKEVEDFKVKRAELEQKVDVINGLRASQRGPVQILDQVSRALPELLWLSKMELPVLVGTTNVEVSETLSRMLKRRGLKHNVLNAKHHKKESEIVAEAGIPGAVTIATNMAGRGTDIKLGEGVTDARTVAWAKAKGLNVEELLPVDPVTNASL